MGHKGGLTNPCPWRGRCRAGYSNTGGPPLPQKRAPCQKKVVDDVTGGQVVPLIHGSAHITTHRETRSIHAVQNEELFNIIRTNADEIGMIVNPKKTQLLCVSSTVNYEANSYINIGQDRITGAEEMKILGFVFGTKPDLWPHIEHIRKKVSCRAWAIRHLKRAGIEKEKLTKIYSALIRPVIEYASQVFYHLLIKAQAETLEKLQRDVFKTIFGFDIPYSCALDESGLPTLIARMERLSIDFAEKISKNPRYEHWFPKKLNNHYELRTVLEFEEDFAPEERLFKIPLFSMRRLLNGRRVYS